MSGEADLPRLLSALAPLRRPGEFVFVTSPLALDATAEAMVRETEGVSYVLHRDEADRRGLPYDFVAAWITLEVHSALDAVGLTAAVSGALAEAGISCNVVAGYFHDHLLVPADRVDAALRILRGVAPT